MMRHGLFCERRKEARRSFQDTPNFDQDILGMVKLGVEVVLGQ